MKKLRKIIAPIVTVIIVIILWEILVKALHVSEKLIPSPSAIFQAFREDFIDIIAPDMWISIKNIFLGYIIAIPIGFVIAALCSQIRVVTRAVTPVLIILMITPMSALTPILKLNMGSGAFLKIIVITLQVAPVVALNSLDGFSNPPVQNVKVLKAMGEGTWPVFFRVVFPNALPQVFTGLELGCILGTISSMAADVAVGNGGLGYRISIYASFASTPAAFATIIIAALIGVVLFEIVSTIQRLVMVWK